MTPRPLDRHSERGVCECGHSLDDHADSFSWGDRTVCTVELPDENDGWYGVCPCVRREALDG